jgi:hypothetical protein
MILEIHGNCEYPDCHEPATHIASGARQAWSGAVPPRPARYCKKHACQVADSAPVGSPDLIVECPNCGCLFGH